MTEPVDYDGAWKEALEVYLGPFLEFCFPAVAAAIDWQVPVEFLDQELQEIVRDADLGKQRVDKLIKVRCRDGSEEWVLVHAEIQSQPDADLAKRIYQYHHRIEDRFGRSVASLVVLADDRAEWHPNAYHTSLWGCELHFHYPTCKLLEHSRDREQLETSDNPIALVIAAHITAQETRGDMDLRAKSKWQLTRRLYERGYDRKQILELFRLIDWFLVLPETLEVEYRQQLVTFEMESSMPHITSIERLGRQEGLLEGRQEGRQEEAVNLVLRLARKRFGLLSLETEATIRVLALNRLEQLSEALLDLRTLSELETWLQTETAVS